MASSQSHRPINNVRSSTANDGHEEAPNTFFFHFTCSRCHHFHIARIFTLPISGHQRYSCDNCQKPLFGVGSNSTQISLASVCTSSSWKASYLPDSSQLSTHDGASSPITPASGHIETAISHEPTVRLPVVAVFPPSGQSIEIGREHQLPIDHRKSDINAIGHDDGHPAPRHHLRNILVRFIRVARVRGSRFVGQKHLGSLQAKQSLPTHDASTMTGAAINPPVVLPHIVRSQSNQQDSVTRQGQSRRPGDGDQLEVDLNDRSPTVNERLHALRKEKTLRKNALRIRTSSCGCTETCQCWSNPPPSSQPENVHAQTGLNVNSVALGGSERNPSPSVVTASSTPEADRSIALRALGALFSDSEARPSSSHNSSSMGLEPSPHVSRQSTSSFSQATTAVGSGSSGARRDSAFRRSVPRELHEFMRFAERTRPDLVSALRNIGNIDRSESPAPIDPSARNNSGRTDSTDFAFASSERQNSNLSVSQTADDVLATRGSTSGGLSRLITTGNFSHHASTVQSTSDDIEQVTPNTAILSGSNERTPTAPQPQSLASDTGEGLAVSRPPPSGELADALRRASEGDTDESDQER